MYTSLSYFSSKTNINIRSAWRWEIHTQESHPSVETHIFLRIQARCTNNQYFSFWKNKEDDNKVIVFVAKILIPQRLLRDGIYKVQSLSHSLWNTPQWATVLSLTFLMLEVTFPLQETFIAVSMLAFILDIKIFYMLVCIQFPIKDLPFWRWEVLGWNERYWRYEDFQLQCF